MPNQPKAGTRGHYISAIPRRPVGTPPRARGRAGRVHLGRRQSRVEGVHQGGLTVTVYRGTIEGVGLDITFFERVEWVGPHSTEWVNPDGSHGYCDHWSAYVNESFPVTQAGVQGGHFVSAGREASWGMSYSGYSRFRACLLHTVRLDLVTSTRPYYPRVWTDEISEEEFRTWPFNELIDFSDCEGSFGHAVSVKLLKDFRKHEHLIEASADALWGPDPSDAWGKRYQGYMEGLSLVGPDGLVTYA